MHAWRDPSLTGKYDAAEESRKLTDGPAPKTEKVRESKGEDVRTEGAGRKVILAKIPSYLYDSWVTQLGKRDASGKISKEAVELGKMTVIEEAGSKKPKFEIALSEPAKALSGPVDELQSSINSTVAMVALSEREGVMAMEGVVEHKCDFRMNHAKVTDEQRHALYEAKKARPTQHDTRAQPTRILPRREAPQERRNNDKFVRMDKPKLQELLFRAFERKPNRTLIDLRNYTEQPTEWLKEVLKDIAVYVKKGPNKCTFQLLPEWGGEDEAAPPPAAVEI